MKFSTGNSMTLNLKGSLIACFEKTNEVKNIPIKNIFLLVNIFSLMFKRSAFIGSY